MSYTNSPMGYANPDAVTQIANGLSTSTFAYDNNGNLAQKTTDGVTTTYVYDYGNRLIALGSQGATTTYGYDAFGSRVFQSTATTTTLYPFKWYSVASSTGTGAKYATTTEYVFNGDSLVSTTDQQTASGAATGTAQTRFIHPDHLGSTNVVTNASGTVVQTLDYYPYGATRISTSVGGADSARKYIGQFADQSNLDYLQARYYDPSRGQFLTEDPVFLSGPKAQNLENPQSLNSYSYANDNPIVGKDPNGLQLTATQNAQLNAIKAQLLAIAASLQNLPTNVSQAVISGVQSAVSAAGTAISNFASGVVGGFSSPTSAQSQYLNPNLPFSKSLGYGVGGILAVQPYGGSESKGVQLAGDEAVQAAGLLEKAEPVGSALKNDIFHRAPTFMKDVAAQSGQFFQVVGKDGKQYVLTQVEGAINGTKGVFEYLVDRAGNLTHQFFKAGGIIDGKPNL